MSNRTGVIILSRKYADKDGVDECLTFSENNTFAELRERLVVRYVGDQCALTDKLKNIPDYMLQYPDEFNPRTPLVYGALLIEAALREAQKPINE